MPRALTPQQYKALKNIAERRPSDFGLRGASQYGGHRQVVAALERKGFIDFEAGHAHFITDDGKAALAAYK